MYKSVPYEYFPENIVSVFHVTDKAWRKCQFLMYYCDNIRCQEYGKQHVYEGLKLRLDNVAKTRSRLHLQLTILVQLKGDSFVNSYPIELLVTQ
jgi:hypothetical protein